MSGKKNKTSRKAAGGEVASGSKHQPLKRNLVIPILGEDVTIPVDMYCIEVVESVYDTSADLVVGYHLVNPMSIKRSLVAETILQWLDINDVYEKYNWKRRDVRDAVISADATKLLQIYIGCIQAGVLYCLRYVTDEDFERLQRGEGLEGNILAPGKRGRIAEPGAGEPS